VIIASLSAENSTNPSFSCACSQTLL